MGVLNNIWGTMRRSRSGSFRDGSSRRGRRNGSGKSGQEDPSTKAESSTHSALFDLELSSRGRGGAADLLARLNSTVHDEGSAQGGAGADPSVRLPSGLLQRVIYLGRPVMEFELDLLQDVRALRSACQTQPDGQLDLSCLVGQLQDLGYACYLKHNNPADPGHRHNVQPSCLEKLRHEFIMVAGRSDGSLSHWCLVDPRFREQFAIAQPTPTYDRLLKAVPLEFVGTPLRLQALVETLCCEMAEAFSAQGRTLPPWRKFKSMLSKWFDPEEMPAPPPPPPAAPAPAPLAANPLVQLQAAAGPPLSPFEAAQAQAMAAAAGVGPSSGGLHQQAAVAEGGKLPSLLQQQAAAALAERQSSGGGSQDFYEALEMHKESMRLQQQAAAQRQSPPRPQHAQQSSPPTPPPQAAGGPAQQQQQGAPAPAPAALSSENLRQLDAFGRDLVTRGAEPAERSNKPQRRRRPPPAGLALASREHHLAAHMAASLWDDEDELADFPGGIGLGALSGAHRAQAQLHNSGSWSELSTILETRSNASSPAAAALMAASNAQLGTSCASRRSAGSSLAIAAAGGLPPPRRSPSRPDQPGPPLPPLSAAGSAATCDTRQAAAGQPSPGSSLVGFAAPPLARSSLARASSAAPSSAQLPSSSSDGSGGSPGAPRPHAGPQGPFEGSARGGKKKVVSLLAKGLKSVGQKQTWANLLPTVSTVRRIGPNGPATAQRSWSWRSGSEDGSSRRGRKAAAAAAAAASAQQQQLPPPYPRHL